MLSSHTYRFCAVQYCSLLPCIPLGGFLPLLLQARVAATGTRDSQLELLLGDTAWVHHLENSIVYSFDAARCMFSSGNVLEKMRMARQDCRGQTVVDMFAGIGYFTLPIIIKGGAEKVYACEWNPHAVKGLMSGLELNGVSHRCTILEGDNRVVAPQGVADRVLLGLIPTSEGSWEAAVGTLRVHRGGTLHVHENVNEDRLGEWVEYLKSRLESIAIAQGRDWCVEVRHVQKVKWYAPHVRHVVADVVCYPKG